MIKHLSISVFGKIQGVFFRDTAKQLAESLNVVGYAKNMSDGSVLIEAEGKEEKLQKLLNWSRHGPATANVSNIDFTFSNKLSGYKQFVIT